MLFAKSPKNPALPSKKENFQENHIYTVLHQLILKSIIRFKQKTIVHKRVEILSKDENENQEEEEKLDQSDFDGA